MALSANSIFYTRLCQVPLAVTAFACVAEWVGKTVKLETFTENKSTVTSFKVSNFTLFCGVSTTVLALAFAVMYKRGVAKARGTFPLIIDSVWTIFWLAAAVVLSLAASVGWSQLGEVSKGDVCGTTSSAESSCYQFAYNDVPTTASPWDYMTWVTVSCAFAWLSSVLSVAFIAIDVKDRRHGHAATASVKEDLQLPTFTPQPALATAAQAFTAMPAGTQTFTAVPAGAQVPTAVPGMPAMPAGVQVMPITMPTAEVAGAAR